MLCRVAVVAFATIFASLCALYIHTSISTYLIIVHLIATCTIATAHIDSITITNHVTGTDLKAFYVIIYAIVPDGIIITTDIYPIAIVSQDIVVLDCIIV